MIPNAPPPEGPAATRVKAVRRWPASTVLAVLGSVFALIAVSLVALLAVDLRLVTGVVMRLHDETVPWTVERQRLARNLEELRMGGQRVLTVSERPARNDALLVVRILAAHPGMSEDPRTASLAKEVEAFLTNSAASADPPDMKVWDELSRRLRLLADDLSVEGGQRVSLELDRMSEAVEQTRYKLLLNVVLVAVFVASFLFILRRYLIQPLQRIHRVLISLDGRGALPLLSSSSMAEIHAVEEAIVRFDATLRENEEVRLKLERLATTDGLTGLPNRRHFLGQAAEEMARARRYGRPITVGIADLDHFKQVNDRFGHAVGDQVLQRFAAVVQETLRETDRVGRFGGEEFAFIFPETTPDEALRLAGRLRQRLGASPLVLPDDSILAVTVSFGLADATGRGLEESLARADAALYQAKGGGRDCSVLAAESASDISPQP